MKKQILNEEFIRMQKLAGIITESQYEDLTYEPEDMDNPDEDLVIIGSGYLDIKNKFRERPSQTNSEYAEIGQKVVDQLHNGDKEAALDFIYSKINESNTNEYESENKAQLDEGETWIDGIWGTGNYKELIHKIENIFQEGGNGASFKCFGKDFTITKTKGGRFLITSSTDFGYEALDINGAFIAAKKFAGITNESQLNEKDKKAIKEDYFTTSLTPEEIESLIAVVTKIDELKATVEAASKIVNNNEIQRMLTVGGLPDVNMLRARITTVYQLKNLKK